MKWVKSGGTLINLDKCISIISLSNTIKPAIKFKFSVDEYLIVEFEDKEKADDVFFKIRFAMKNELMEI